MHELDPTATHRMPSDIFRTADEPYRQQRRLDDLETAVRRLHAWVTFCVTLVAGLVVLTVVVLLQLGGWIRVLP